MKKICITLPTLKIYRIITNREFLDMVTSKDYIKNCILFNSEKICQTLAEKAVLKIEHFDFPKPEPIVEVDSDGDHEKN